MGSVQVGTTILKFAAAIVHVDGRALLYLLSQLPPLERQRPDRNCAPSAAAWRSRCSATWGSKRLRSPAAKVRDPDRNIPRATIMGTLATAVVYILSLVAIFGILPNSTLAPSSQPFSEAANAMFGGSWPGDVMAIAVIISGLGALNGWTMICAEMPLAAANDGLFPDRFKHLSKGASRPSAS